MTFAGLSDLPGQSVCLSGCQGYINFEKVSRALFDVFTTNGWLKRYKVRNSVIKLSPSRSLRGLSEVLGGLSDDPRRPLGDTK